MSIQTTSTTMPRAWRLVIVSGVATALFCLILMAWVDAPLALYVHDFVDHPIVDAFEAITDLANSAIWYSLALVGMLAAYWEARRATSPGGKTLFRQRLRAAAFVLVSMITSGVLINALKLIVGRARPKVLFKTGLEDFQPFDQALSLCSFPSGHSQSIWGAMIALAWVYPQTRIPAFILAALVSASRVVIGVHFLSDIIAGAYFAFAAALLWRVRFERDGVGIQLGKEAQR